MGSNARGAESPLQRAMRASDEASQRIYARQALDHSPEDAFERFVRADAPSAACEEACAIAGSINRQKASDVLLACLLERNDAALPAAANALGSTTGRFDELAKTLGKINAFNPRAAIPLLSAVYRQVANADAKGEQIDGHWWLFLHASVLPSEEYRSRSHAMSCLAAVAELSQSPQSSETAARTALDVCTHLAPQTLSDFDELAESHERCAGMLAKLNSRGDVDDGVLDAISQQLTGSVFCTIWLARSRSDTSVDCLRFIQLIARLHGSLGKQRHLLRLSAVPLSALLNGWISSLERTAVLRLLESIESAPHDHAWSTAGDSLPTALAYVCFTSRSYDFKLASKLLHRVSTSPVASSTGTRKENGQTHCPMSCCFSGYEPLNATLLSEPNRLSDSWLSDLHAASRLAYMLRKAFPFAKQYHFSSEQPLGLEASVTVLGSVIHKESFAKKSSGRLKQACACLQSISQLDCAYTARLLPLVLQSIQQMLSMRRVADAHLLCEHSLSLSRHSLASQIMPKLIGSFTNGTSPSGNALSIHLLTIAWRHQPGLWNRLRAAIGATIRNRKSDSAVRTAAAQAVSTVCQENPRLGRELLNEVQEFLFEVKNEPAISTFALDALASLCHYEVLDCVLTVKYVWKETAFSSISQLLSHQSVALLRGYVNLLHECWQDADDAQRAEASAETENPPAWRLQLLTKDVIDHLWILATANAHDLREEALDSLCDFPSEETGCIGRITPRTAASITLHHVQKDRSKTSGCPSFAAAKMLRRLVVEEEKRLPRSKKEAKGSNSGNALAADSGRAYRALYVIPRELLSKHAGAFYGTNLAAASVATENSETLKASYLDAVQRGECPNFASFTMLYESLRSLFAQWLESDAHETVAEVVMQSLGSSYDENVHSVGAVIGAASFSAALKERLGATSRSIIERCADLLVADCTALTMLDQEDYFKVLACALTLSELPLRDQSRANRFVNALINDLMRSGTNGYCAGIESLALVSSSQHMNDVRLALLQCVRNNLPLPVQCNWSSEIDHELSSTDAVRALPEIPESAKADGALGKALFHAIGFMAAKEALGSASTAEWILVDAIDVMKESRCSWNIEFAESIPSLVKCVPQESLNKLNLSVKILELAQDDCNHGVDLCPALGRLVHSLPTSCGLNLSLDNVSQIVQQLKHTCGTSASARARQSATFGISNALGTCIAVTDIASSTQSHESGASNGMLSGPLVMDSNSERQYRECFKALERTIQQEKLVNARAMHEWSAALSCSAIKHMTRSPAAVRRAADGPAQKAVPLESLPRHGALKLVTDLLVSENTSCSSTENLFTRPLIIDFPFNLPETSFEGNSSRKESLQQKGLTVHEEPASPGEQARIVAMRALCTLRVLPKANWHAYLTQTIMHGADVEMRKSAMALALAQADSVPILISETLCNAEFLRSRSPCERCELLAALSGAAKVVEPSILFNICSEFIAERDLHERREALTASGVLRERLGSDHENTAASVILGSFLDGERPPDVCVPISESLQNCRPMDGASLIEREWLAFSNAIARLHATTVRYELTLAGAELQPPRVSALCVAITRGLQSPTRLEEALAHLARFQRTSTTDALAASVACALQQAATGEQVLQLLSQALKSIRGVASSPKIADTCVAAVAVMARAASSTLEGALVMQMVARGDGHCATEDAMKRLPALLPQAVRRNAAWCESLASALLDAVEAQGNVCRMELSKALIACRAELPRDAFKRYLNAQESANQMHMSAR